MSEMTEMLANLLMQTTGKSAGYDITDPRDLTRLQADEFDKRQRLKNRSWFNREGAIPIGEAGNDEAGPRDPRDPRSLGDIWDLENKQKALRELLEHAKMQPLPDPQIPLLGAQNLGGRAAEPSTLGAIKKFLTK